MVVTDKQIEAGVAAYLACALGKCGVRSHEELCRDIYLAMRALEEPDVERVAFAAALESLRWDDNHSLVEAAEKVRDNGWNNGPGFLSNYMCGRLLDAYGAARAAIAQTR